MEHEAKQLKERPEPTQPNTDAGQSEQDPTVRTGEVPMSGRSAPTSKDPKVPPASETWVEGQPASDADYPDKGKRGRGR